VVLRNYKKDGTPFWNELNVSPLRDEKGRLANFVGVQNDVTEHKEAERRVAAQHTVTRILAESLTLGDAAPRMLQALCESLRWEFGELWTLDRQAGVLRCVQTWSAPSVEVAEFDEITRRHIFARGVGLPGRVWNSGEPAWVTDVAVDTNFPRTSVAAKAGLRGAVAFPILLGGEVLGVVGFYSQEIREPDGEVLQMMSTIGSQIGQFIERKHAEEALRRSEQHLSSVVTNAPVVLFALDHEGVFMLSEGKGLEALGLNSGQLVGSSALEMYREAPQITGDIRRALAGEEFSAITEMDGLIFETWFSPVLLEESGEVAGVIGVATDVTERKKAQEERERLSHQSELILNSAGEGIFGLDRQGRTRFANPAAAMLGYEPGELIDRRQHDLIHHSHPDGSTYLVEECPIYMALRDGIVHQVDDEVFWRKDGTSFPVEYTSTPILENEEITGTVVIFSDTTERRRAEEESNLLRTVALEVSEAEDLSSALRVVLCRVCEATNWAIGQVWVPSVDGTVLECSPAWCTTVDNLAAFRAVNEGLVFEPGIGFPGHVWSTKRAAWSRDITVSNFVRAPLAAKFGLKAAMDIPVLAGSEVVAVLDFFVFEEREEDERLVELVSGVAAQLGSVIQRKRAEENLRAYAARLNRSNRDLQDFAYVASHDLQEPLRKVRTFADRLNVKYAEVLGEQGRDYLERMAGAAARMQDLIDDLLELSRVTTKAQPFTPVDLSEVAQEVISDLEARIDQIGGRVEVSGLPTVEADRPQMRQLLQNLIGNALKFHREGKTPIIKVYGAFVQKRKEEPNGRAADGGVCQILVEDNGIGFDEEHFERIFVPFQRLHGRTDYEGTGMGLAICRKVVERHGGNITAKSVPGRGATFIVTLPVKQSEGNP